MMNKTFFSAAWVVGNEQNWITMREAKIGIANREIAMSGLVNNGVRRVGVEVGWDRFRAVPAGAKNLREEAATPPRLSRLWK